MLLDDYDHERIRKPEGEPGVYELNYSECRKIIDDMSMNENSRIFGIEKDESFKSSISTIYQTIDGNDIYPSMQEKAANLLYLITKNHSFVDGNKRIAATMFLIFLDKNNSLYTTNHEKIIADDTLVSLTIMIAESRSREKETLINLVMNFLI
jgi:death-on-curing family protein